MEIPILVEPSSTGFRASTGGPFHFEADASSADEATFAVQAQIASRLQSGAHLRVMTISDVEKLITTAKSVGEDPQFADWLIALEEYRRIHNAPVDLE